MFLNNSHLAFPQSICNARQTEMLTNKRILESCAILSKSICHGVYCHNKVADYSHIVDTDMSDKWLEWVRFQREGQ